MRLGVLLAGDGVGALGAVGMLRALQRKGTAPYAICGVGAGAYPAALWACGMNVEEMIRCVDVLRASGMRLIDRERIKLAFGHDGVFCKGKRIARLLAQQTQGMSLRECARPAAFLCMAIPARRTVIFSPSSPEETGAVWTDHAPVWFAARAALSTPPLIRPAAFIGVPLCAHPDAREGVRALYAMGATHVAAAYPVYARGIPQGPLDLIAWENARAFSRTLSGIRQVQMEMPEYIQPLGFEDIPACVRAGERAGSLLDWHAWEEEAGNIVTLWKRTEQEH